MIAAIFGTSILRDFQRDTYQILFTQPISKFAYLGGRWAGSFVTTVFARLDADGFDLDATTLFEFGLHRLLDGLAAMVGMGQP